MNFQKEIIEWYNTHKRNLPWRHTTNPYIIWLSEVILQQTRVEQGLPYFNRFLERFPTVNDFAAATEDQVLKLWQGLGYYSRGRNMLITAQQVVNIYGGEFPHQYQALIGLKGIGEYTAAAISSFSANENRAVVDGNVFRVLARYFGVHEPINGAAGRKIISSLAQDLIEGQQAAVYNQAIMEFGALQCKPKSPVCEQCTIAYGCLALQQGMVAELPRKLKKAKVRERWLNYFVANSGSQILIKQRQLGDIWEKLYDFPLIESTGFPDLMFPEFISSVEEMFGKGAKITFVSKKRHILSHQIIYVQFFALENYMINFNLHTEIKSVSQEEFRALPHPKVISDFIEMYL